MSGWRAMSVRCVCNCCSAMQRKWVLDVDDGGSALARSNRRTATGSTGGRRGWVMDGPQKDGRFAGEGRDVSGRQRSATGADSPQREYGVKVS